MRHSWRRLEGRRWARQTIRPGFQHYVELVESGCEIAFLRRAHGFWDRLVDLTHVSPQARAAVVAALAGGPPVDERIVEGLTIEQQHALEEGKSIKAFWTSEGYAAELIHDLQHPHWDTTYLEAAQPFPGRNPTAELRDVYRAFHTSGKTFHSALVWRQAVRDGVFGRLIDALRRYRVVVVAPPEKASLGGLAGIADFTHIELHPTHAFAERIATLDKIRAAVGSSPDQTAILFEAGSLASWLIHRSWEGDRPRVMLDVGQALDVWYPDVIRQQLWFKRHGRTMVRRMGLEDLYRSS